MGSVTDFSLQDVHHADLFISLTVSVDYQRNELSRLHRGVYEAAHTILSKPGDQKYEYEIAGNGTQTHRLLFGSLASGSGLVRSLAAPGPALVLPRRLAHFDLVAVVLLIGWPSVTQHHLFHKECTCLININIVL